MNLNDSENFNPSGNIEWKLSEESGEEMDYGHFNLNSKENRNEDSTIDFSEEMERLSMSMNKSQLFLDKKKLYSEKRHIELTDSYRLFKLLGEWIKENKGTHKTDKNDKNNKNDEKLWKRRFLEKVFARRSAQTLYIPYNYEEPIPLFCNFTRKSFVENLNFLDEKESVLFKNQSAINQIQKSARNHIKASEESRKHIKKIRDHLSELEISAFQQTGDMNEWSWSTWLHNDISNNHMLESVMRMLSVLPVRPRNIKNTRHLNVDQTNHMYCPQAGEKEDFEKILNKTFIQKGKDNSNCWNIHNFYPNHNVEVPIYEDITTGEIQLGMPFDIQCRTSNFFNLTSASSESGIFAPSLTPFPKENFETYKDQYDAPVFSQNNLYEWKKPSVKELYDPMNSNTEPEEFDISIEEVGDKSLEPVSNKYQNDTNNTSPLDYSNERMLTTEEMKNTDGINNTYNDINNPKTNSNISNINPQIEDSASVTQFCNDLEESGIFTKKFLENVKDITTNRLNNNNTITHDVNFATRLRLSTKKFVNVTAMKEIFPSIHEWENVWYNINKYNENENENETETLLTKDDLSNVLSSCDFKSLLDLALSFVLKGMLPHALAVLCHASIAEFSNDENLPTRLIISHNDRLTLNFLTARLSFYVFGTIIPLKSLSSYNIQSSDRNTMLTRASSLYCLEKYKDAEKVLHEIYRNNHQCIETTRALSLLIARIGYLEEDNTYLLEALRLQFVMLSLKNSEKTDKSISAVCNTNIRGFDSIYWLRLEHGWLNEYCQCDSAVILNAYKSALPKDVDDLSWPFVHTALGRFYHTRGQYNRAKIEYERAMKADNQNHMVLFLHAMLAVNSSIELAFEEKTDFKTSADVSINIPINLAEVDAHFRLGFLSIGNSRYSWLAYLGYAAFCAGLHRTVHQNESQIRFSFTGGDCRRVEESLWQAFMVSSSKMDNKGFLYSTIALAHFYQYTRSRPKFALSVLTLNISHCTLNITSKKSINDLFDGDESIALLIVKAYLYTDMGMENLALEQVNEAVQKSPIPHPSIVRFLGRHLWREGEKIQAIEYMNSFLKSSDVNDKTTTYGLRIKIHPKFNRFTENPYFMRTLSIMSALLGKFDTARSHLQRALIANRVHHRSFYLMAILTYLLGESVDKIGQVEKRHNISKQEQRCYDTLKYLDKCLSICPDDIDALLMKSQILMELGDFQTSLKMLQYLHRLNSNSNIVKATLARCIYHNETTAAREIQLHTFFREAISNENKENLIHNEILYWYAMFLLITEQNKKAIGRNNEADTSIKSGREILEDIISNKNCEFHLVSLYTLGWLYEKDGDLENAESYYLQCINKASSVSIIMWRRLVHLAENTSKLVKGALKHAIHIQNRRNPRVKITEKSIGLSLSMSFGDPFVSDDEVINNPESAYMLRKRLDLHKKIDLDMKLKTAEVERENGGKIITPGKFVFIDLKIFENLYDEFDECEDWSWLLRSCQTYRKT